MTRVLRSKTSGWLAVVAVGAVVVGMTTVVAYRVVRSAAARHATTTSVFPDLKGRRLFSESDQWNRDISTDAVDEKSAGIIERIGASLSLHPDFGASYNGDPFGIPFVTVTGNQGTVPVTFRNATESDAGPYPIPPGTPIEGGEGGDGDRHVLILDTDNWKLFELYRAFPEDGGRRWRAESGAIFDLSKPSTQRPIGHTSADAAGLPVLPGLVRYDEVAAGKIAHALRFTVRRSRRAFVDPARHFASKDDDERLPPMGMRVRLRQSFDISRFAKNAQVILRALQTYGMIVADNGGNWYVSGTPDSRWNDDEIQQLRKVKGADFEVVRMGRIVTPVEEDPR